ncbi:MAG: class I SAM-dependent methyltransferase [Opitutaceae bacterium]
MSLPSPGAGGSVGVSFMNWLDRYHASRVHTRRVRVLAETAARLLPPNVSVLDVGCGDGLLAATLGRLRPDLAITGVEIAPRPGCHIPVTAFDGQTLPFADGSFDVTMIVDVLHHTDDPAILFREVTRVARTAVLLKDHLREGWAAQSTLRFMDQVGNRRHGVPLPFNYLNRAEWDRLFTERRLTVEVFDPVRQLYPWPARLVFGRGLHFFARLGKTSA